MKLSKMVVLAVALTVLPAQAVETLRIDISHGFSPLLESLKPRLVQQLGMNVEVVSRPNIELYSEFNKDSNKKNTSSDLVIFVENTSYGMAKTNQFLNNHSQIIAASQVILWCPNSPLPKRVSLLDTLFQARISSIAVPPKDSRAGSIFYKSVLNIPARTRLLAATDSLSAWRMARNKQAQCAVTLDKWLRPGEQFVYISNEEIILRGYINPASKHNLKARQVINLLSSPLIQPFMMRATSIELAQNRQKLKKPDLIKRVRAG